MATISFFMMVHAGGGHEKTRVTSVVSSSVWLDFIIFGEMIHN